MQTQPEDSHSKWSKEGARLNRGCGLYLSLEGFSGLRSAAGRRPLQTLAASGDFRLVITGATTGDVTEERPGEDHR
jgi:hypothetical protein